MKRPDRLETGLMVLILLVGASAAGAGELGPSVERFTEPSAIAEFQVAPVYPAAASLGGFTGTVDLKALVNADGTVRTVRVVDCDHPNLGFEAASIAAVQQWRFHPAVEDGEPTDAIKRVTIRFRTTDNMSAAAHGPTDGTDVPAYSTGVVNVGSNVRQVYVPQGQNGRSPANARDVRLNTVNLPPSQPGTMYNRASLIPPKPNPGRPAGAGKVKK